MKCYKLILIVSLFLPFQALLPQSVSTQANASANLIKPLSITSLSGEINFGEIILTGTSTVQNLSPQYGRIFKVDGHPNKLITVTFSSITLSNVIWTSIYGGTSGTMVFVPNVVHTAASAGYENPVNVVSGNSYSLVSSGGTGLLYLWVGGNINIASSQPQGDYTGTFNVTVSY